MAQGKRLVCGKCGNKIETWDDGNPYFIDSNGQKQYAHHPSRERERCIGNESPHLCLNCGREFMVDSRSPATRCENCESTNFVDTWDLEGHSCPKCKQGKFEVDFNWCLIS